MSPIRGATDRRVQKTRSVLHGALASLVHEKPYEDIVVKEILARADVARSTFYAHYRDKDELLERGIRELLIAGATRLPDRRTDATGRVLRFSMPFLEHVEGFRVAGLLPLGPEQGAGLHQQLGRVLERLLADELRAERRRRASVPCALAPELLARHVASTFVVTLAWWLEHPALPARDVDAHFRALVEPTLRAALGD